MKDLTRTLDSHCMELALVVAAWLTVVGVSIQTRDWLGTFATAGTYKTDLSAWTIFSWAFDYEALSDQGVTHPDMLRARQYRRTRASWLLLLMGALIVATATTIAAFNGLPLAVRSAFFATLFFLAIFNVFYGAIRKSGALHKLLATLSGLALILTLAVVLTAVAQAAFS